MNTLALRQLDGTFWLAAVAGAKVASFAIPLRRPDPRPLILRPGGMGDLILLTIAAEELGLDPRDFFWVIERRSRVWAKHLRLDHICYDDGLFARHLQLAGRFSTIINSEQRFGLSQATALLACGRRATVTCFDTNRAAVWACRRVAYDADQSHETVEFQKLLGAALGISGAGERTPKRSRRSPAAELPVVGLGGLQSESRAFSEKEWERFIRHWIGDGEFWIASSETDRPFAKRLEARFGGRASVFEGGFGAMCDLIRHSEDVLTVDGGFLHIASYYGVPVTGIFTSGRERKWAALAPGSRVIRRSDLACQPCTWFGQVPKCRNEFACKEFDFDQRFRADRSGPNNSAQPGLLPVMRG
jgi:hypothetical protein